MKINATLSTSKTAAKVPAAAAAPHQCTISTSAPSSTSSPPLPLFPLSHTSLTFFLYCFSTYFFSFSLLFHLNLILSSTLSDFPIPFSYSVSSPSSFTVEGELKEKYVPFSFSFPFSHTPFFLSPFFTSVSTLSPFHSSSFSCLPLYFSVCLFSILLLQYHGG